ncbi:membrane dipeptidase [bacterium]|nr:membrane dipeptidase [bacterium]
MELADLHVDTPLNDAPVINAASLAEFESLIINFAFCFLKPISLASMSKTISVFQKSVPGMHPHLFPIYSIEGLGEFDNVEDVLYLIDEYDMSVVSLSWNKDSLFGGGCFGAEAGGLTSMGDALLNELAKRNTVVDISHASPKLADDILRDYSRVIATHSNAHHIMPHERNLRDGLIRHTALSGGLIGVNFYRKFIAENGTLSDLLRHIEHIIAVAGENCIALGSDLDGMDDGVISEPSGFKGLYDAVVKGFSESIAKKLFFENVKKYFSIST